jgi:hypothetical protein
MAAQKQFETRVEVTGGVDSSLQKAIGESVAELNRLQNYTKGLNKMLEQSNLAANGLTPALRYKSAWAQTVSGETGWKVYVSRPMHGRDL